MTDIVKKLTDLSRIRQGADAVVNQTKRRSSIMMLLGPFIFAVDTAAYQQLRRSTQYNWPAQSRIGQLPELQYTGPGTESLDISGEIYPEFAGGLYQMQAMRELAGLGKPMVLVDGLGVVYGTWVITSIEETLSEFHSNGAAQRIEFSLKLQRYGKDKQEKTNTGKTKP